MNVPVVIWHGLRGRLMPDATLSAGGRSYRIGTRARRVSVGMPAKPKQGVLTLRLTIRAAGQRQRPVRVTLFVLRA